MAGEKERSDALKTGRLRQGKSAANRAHYEKVKGNLDSVVMRLEKGGRARIDKAARACGLTRVAFAQLYLLAFAEAIQPHRVAKLGALSCGRRVNLATALGRLIDEAEGEVGSSNASHLTAEFDELFGPGT